MGVSDTKCFIEMKQVRMVLGLWVGISMNILKGKALVFCSSYTILPASGSGAPVQWNTWVADTPGR